MGIISDNLYLNRRKILKKYIEEKKYRFLVRAYGFENIFWGQFYEFSVENACADMYDLFEIRKKMSLKRYIRSINERTGGRYYKMMAFIHLTEFLKDRQRNEEGYIAFKEIFKPDKTEERFFDLLFRCFVEFKEEFSKVRSAVFLKYAFGISGEGDNMLAFADSFCYNSYNEFICTFNRFMTIERRMEQVK